MQKGKVTLNEITSQPEAWEKALGKLTSFQDALYNQKPNSEHAQLIFTGCGSTYYLAKAAAAVTQKMTGITARAFPASELWLYPESAYTNQETKLIAISRSAETTETIRACKLFQKEKFQRGCLLLCKGTKNKAV